MTSMETEIPGLRPRVISRETALALDEFLGFRHFFRSLYADDLIPGRLLALASHLPGAAAAFRGDLAAFDRFLEKLVDAGRG